MPIFPVARRGPCARPDTWTRAWPRVWTRALAVCVLAAPGLAGCDAQTVDLAKGQVALADVQARVEAARDAWQHRTLEPCGSTLAVPFADGIHAFTVPTGMTPGEMPVGMPPAAPVQLSATLEGPAHLDTTLWVYAAPREGPLRLLAHDDDSGAGGAAAVRTVVLEGQGPFVLVAATFHDSAAETAQLKTTLVHPRCTERPDMRDRDEDEDDRDDERGGS